MVSDWPIVIGGSHRSGTTLLRRLLNGHPRIFCPPEIKFHKDLLGQYPDDPLAHGRLGSSIRALGLPTELWLDEFGGALCRCYDVATLNAGKRRWADKSPENALNIAHWDRLLRGCFAFILVVRHPFDIVASMAEIRMDKNIPIDTLGRASHVRDYITAGLAFVDSQPHRSIIIRYEHLVSRSQDTLRELMHFLNEEYDDAMISRLHSDQHGEGLEDPKVRHHNGISNESIGRWRKDLSTEHLSIIKPILAEISQRLTYEVE